MRTPFVFDKENSESGTGDGENRGGAENAEAQETIDHRPQTID